MKSMTLIMFLLTSTSIIAQKPILFDLDVIGNLTTTDSYINLKPPIELNFKNTYNGKTIKFFKIDGKTKITELIFGSNGFITSGSNIFQIIIDEKGDMISNSTSGNKNISEDKFKIQVENTSQIEITLNRTIINGTANDSKNFIPGYLYYDAIELVNRENDPGFVKAMLKLYGINGDNISNNPYLNDIFKEAYSMAAPEGALGSLMTNLGNTDVTNFAVGLARFLAGRTKEELNEAFFNKMKEQLNSYPELKTVFPKTASFLDVIETYSYASVIQVLKEAFETDIQNLPVSLYNVSKLAPSNCSSSNICSCGKKSNCKKIPAEQCDDCEKCKCEGRLKKIKDFFLTMEGQWIGLGMFTVKEAVQSTNPFDLLSSISVSSELIGIKSYSKQKVKFDDYNLASSIELANFISQSLKSKEENQIWISSKELHALFKDNDLKTFKIYLGLLLAKEQKGDVSIDFYCSDGIAKKIGDILKEIHTKANDANNNVNVYEQTKTLIRNTYSAFNSANSAVKKIIAASEKSLEADPQALYDYYRTFTASLKPIVNSEILKTITGKTDIGDRYYLIEQFLNPSVDIAYHTATKKYSAAVYDAVLLLNNNKYPIFEKPIVKSFVKYGTLISTVANAQSSDEVKQALDASVLPVGSSSIKRNSNWSISINAYVGGYWSYQSDQNQIPIMGLSAPIGVNFSKGGLNKWFKGFSSSGDWGGLSANFQIIDLGALVNYYLLKGDTASIPNDFTVRLSNIFAPGFNLCYNIPKTPLSIAWGGQYIPTLYKYEQINGTNQLTPSNAFRMQFSVFVDIPMYNLKVWDFKK